MCHIFLIHSLVEAHLSCFQFGYEKQCCYEHSWAHVFVVWLIYIQKCYCWVLRKVVSKFSEKLSHWHPKGLYQLGFPTTMQKCSFYPHSLSSISFWSVFLILAILTGLIWNLRVVLIRISLMTKDIEHFLKCFLVILDSSVESSLFRSLLHF